MRIAVTQFDLSSGRLSDVARHLMRLLPDHCRGLAQAQNVMARCLGYRDLHQLQQQALPDGNPRQATAGLVSGFGWNLHRHFGMPYHRAAEVARQLPLGLLGSGERPSLVPGTAATRALIDASLPPYRRAVVGSPTKPGDQWLLKWEVGEHLVNSLPELWRDDVHAQVQIDAPHVQAQAMPLFENSVLHDLVLNAGEPLHQALAAGRFEHPDLSVIEVRWKDGAPFGRAIYHQGYDAIFPRVFALEGDEIYSGLAQLICGGSPAWTKPEQWSMSDLELGNPPRTDRPGDWRPATSVHLPVGKGARAGEITIGGDMFSADGGVFVHLRNWVSPADIPKFLPEPLQTPWSGPAIGVLDIGIRGKAPPLRRGRAAHRAAGDLRLMYGAAGPHLPANAMARYGRALLTELSNRGVEASRLMSGRIEEAVDAILALAPPESLRQAVSRSRLNNGLHDEFWHLVGTDEEREQRAAAISQHSARLFELGRALIDTVPGLGAFDPATLGYVRSLMDSSEARAAQIGRQQALDAGDVVSIIAMLGFHLARAAQGEKIRRCSMGWHSIGPLLLEALLDGRVAPAEFADAGKELDEFLLKLVMQGLWAQSTETAMAREAERQSLRKGGVLYAEDRIEPGYPAPATVLASLRGGPEPMM